MRSHEDQGRTSEERGSPATAGVLSGTGKQGAGRARAISLAGRPGRPVPHPIALASPRKAGVRHGLVLVRDARRAARPEGQGRRTRIERGPTTGRGRDRTRRSRRSVLGERLEARTLLTAVPGYDYVVTGYSWPNPSHITYSIAPDGVLWDHGTNDLNAVFNAKFGTSGIWQAQIARALATWESVANINIVPVTDGPYEQNVLGNAQSDPRFGDIRFGGYNFSNNTTTLAQTYFPPPNGSTAAGDVEVNTAMGFNINSTYDVYSVLLHETGHSLGLDHAKNPAEVMYSVYGGIRTGLVAGDIAGIQAIYGARSLDSYQRQGFGFGFTRPSMSRQACSAPTRRGSPAWGSRASAAPSISASSPRATRAELSR